MSTWLTSVEKRLQANHVDIDENHCHIEVNQAMCAGMTGDLLIAVCPAGVYSRAANGDMLVEFAACLECGTCLAVAPQAQNWVYPRGAHGIRYIEG